MKTRKLARQRTMALILLLQLIAVVGSMAAIPVPVVQVPTPFQPPAPWEPADPGPAATPESESTATPAGPLAPAGPVATNQPSATPRPAITNIIHQLRFPAQTVSDSLSGIFNRSAETESANLAEQAGEWASILGQVIQAPQEDFYQIIAQSSLPVGAALAPALFLLRLAIYHWQRLVGENDSAVRVVGDWVIAGVLAVAAGPFLDLLTRLGWWIAGATLGETAELGKAFVESMSVVNVAEASTKVTFFSGIVAVGLALGGILALAGLLFSFVVANVALYIMAVVAVPIAVAAVIPQMRWLSTLWLKAAALLSLLPIVAGGIFKAGVSLGFTFADGGMLSALIRLLWVWGATGFLIKMATILGQVSLSTGVGAVGHMAGAVKGIASTAIMAGGVGGAALGGVASRVGLAGGGAAASGGPGASGAATAGTAAMSASGGMGGGPVASLQGQLHHNEQAMGQTQKAARLSAMGLSAPAQYARSQVQLHEAAGRRLALQERLSNFQGIDGGDNDDGGGGDGIEDILNTGGTDGNDG